VPLASKDLRAVIAGAGVAGLLHALALRAAGVTIAGVFDPDQARARALAEQCGGAQVAANIDALADIDAEIANICSPPAVHVAQAERLVRAGKRIIFVEKPVAVSLEELDRLRALPGCVPVVQWRAGRAIRAVRRAIARGELGDAPVVSCDLAWGRDDAYVRARGASWGAGAVLSVGIHAIDAMLWAIGQKVVEANGVTLRREGAWAETGAVGLVLFDGGALASLRISFDGGADVTRIAFCGRGVTAIIEGGEGDPTASSVKWIAPVARRAVLEALERETDGATGSPLLVPYIGDAIAAVREGRVPGDTQRLPSIADSFEAHATALRLSSGA
jgi:predicted dehydrogenase